MNPEEIKKTIDLGNQYLAGGITSAYNYLKGINRVVVTNAYGCRIRDIEGREFIDWMMGFGSLLLGHNPQQIKDALQTAMMKGFLYQYESPLNAELAKEVCEAIPCAEKVRLANSGTEVTLNAIRVARGATGRTKILKFEGHYHGVNDYLLYSTDSPPLSEKIKSGDSITPVPGSAGLPDDAMKELLIVVPYNDINRLEAVFRKYGKDIAGVIIEPVSFNMGCVRPDDKFLEDLRNLCDKYGSILIFDEVLSGFRVAYGGAGAYFAVKPDLVCLGKAFGCGMPIAALAGKEKYMNVLAPTGNVLMAGTNTGRYMTVAGTLAAIRELKKPKFYENLNSITRKVIIECKNLFEHFHVPAYVDGLGGVISIYFGIQSRPRNFRDIISNWNVDFHMTCYKEAFKKGLFGFLLPFEMVPGPFVLSSAHTTDDIDETLTRFEDILKRFPYSELNRNNG